MHPISLMNSYQQKIILDAMIAAVREASVELEVVNAYTANPPSPDDDRRIAKAEHHYRETCDALFYLMDWPAINWKERAQ